MAFKLIVIIRLLIHLLVTSTMKYCCCLHNYRERFKQYEKHLMSLPLYLQLPVIFIPLYRYVIPSGIIFFLFDGLQHFFVVSLLVMNISVFVCLKISLLCLHFWKIFLLDIELSVDSFSFGTLKMLLNFLLVCFVSDKKM